MWGRIRQFAIAKAGMIGHGVKEQPAALAVRQCLATIFSLRRWGLVDVPDLDADFGTHFPRPSTDPIPPRLGQARVANDADGSRMQTPVIHPAWRTPDNVP